MKIDKQKRSIYGGCRLPAATYSFGGMMPGGVEILDVIEEPAGGGFSSYVVWRWSNERDAPRMSRLRGAADGDFRFRVNCVWISLSECERADRSPFRSRKPL